MKPASAEIISWFESIVPGTVVLTPNNRLSRFIQHQYAVHQRQQGRQAWPTVTCYSLNGWVQSLWEQLQQGCYPGSDRILLTSVQESIIWERIIRDQSQGHELLNPRQTAIVAMDAWHKSVQWRLERDRATPGTPDKALYTRWTGHYLDYCRTGRLTDSSQIIKRLIEAVNDPGFGRPQAIALYGFDVMSPLARDLLDAFSGRGVNVVPVTMAKEAAVRRIEFADEDEEIKTAARWAAEKITAASDQDGVQIGIVVPQLTRLRPRVERHFNNVFWPRGLLIDEPRRGSGINISAAQTLADTPPVNAALNALQLNLGTVDMELVSHVLRSPFIGSFSELNRRALLDVELQGEFMNMDCARLRSAATRPLNKGKPEFICPDLHRRLQAFIQFSRSLRSRTRMPGEWIEVFNTQLTMLGWPGERSPDTLEQQQVSHWREVMQSLAGLDTVTGQCHIADALAYLNHLARQYPFHVRTAPSPVQVLGLLEAGGMLFDYTWVMNMDGRNWPMSPTPNPLISIQKQVELRMPNASVDVELEFARAMTQRFAGSAGQVIFSYSSFRDEQVQVPSPLVEKYQTISAEDLQLITDIDYYRQLFQYKALEATVDDRGPGITNPAAIRGGTQILKDQAACPFRSFAMHRLHAKAIEQAQPGINPLQHGTLMHRALEILWRRLEDLDTLLRMDGAALNTLIDAAVTESFAALPNHKHLGNRLRDLQSERMQALLHAWLLLEKLREPFSVALHEDDRDLEIAGLPLKVRYDRIDRLADGNYFVIDYKTGKLDIKSWSGERPDEPQVPIYCLASENITGAAFGIINVREMGFKGIAGAGTIAPGLLQPGELASLELPGTWREILEQWRRVLEQLARRFLDGYAEVDPKSIKTSCCYCPLPGLCRISESVTDTIIPGEENGE